MNNTPHLYLIPDLPFGESDFNTRLYDRPLQTLTPISHATATQDSGDHGNSTVVTTEPDEGLDANALTIVPDLATSSFPIPSHDGNFLHGELPTDGIILYPASSSWQQYQPVTPETGTDQSSQNVWNPQGRMSPTHNASFSGYDTKFTTGIAALDARDDATQRVLPPDYCVYPEDEHGSYVTSFVHTPTHSGTSGTQANYTFTPFARDAVDSQERGDRLPTLSSGRCASVQNWRSVREGVPSAAEVRAREYIRIMNAQKAADAEQR